MMASRRKQPATPAYERTREFKLRLPPDISERIERKAHAEGRPQNRVIINELASIPHLERQRELGDVVEDMKALLARQGARMILADLSDELLRSIKDASKANRTGNIPELQAHMDKVAVILEAMERQNHPKRK